MTATLPVASGETVKVSTRASDGGALQVVLWTKHLCLACTPDEARAVGVALLDQALRADRSVDASWPDEVPC